MYIESLSLRDFRCFDRAEMKFQYPGRRHGSNRAPRLNNVNLLLGDNGAGKTSVLKAIALAVLSQMILADGFRSYYNVRRIGLVGRNGSAEQGEAELRIELRLHRDDSLAADEELDRAEYVSFGKRVTTQTIIKRRGDIETLDFSSKAHPATWRGLYINTVSPFFIAGYGATRRVENSQTFDSAYRDKVRGTRYQRVAGLFEDYASLAPPNILLDELTNRGHRDEGIALLNSLIPLGVELDAIPMHSDGPVFLVNGTPLPFSQLSDGYRAFIGWVCDLLYHLSRVIDPHERILDIHGVVIVDEIDLLLHPDWQRTVIDSIATTFPHLQFILTSHSPIIAGTLEPANILIVETDSEDGGHVVRQGKANVHGLSADQILSSPYFDVATSSSPDAVIQMKELARKAWEGDQTASLEFLRRMTEGFTPEPSLLEKVSNGRPNKE